MLLKNIRGRGLSEELEKTYTPKTREEAAQKQKKRPNLGKKQTQEKTKTL